MEVEQESSAYEMLTSLIRKGAFDGGEELRAARLAEMIGVSRTPVREALSRLAAEGIVEIRPNRGARLAQLTESDLRDIYLLRSTIEPQAAALAAEAATVDELAGMEDLLVRMESLEGTDPVSMALRAKLNLEFHLAIVRASGSPLLESLYSRANREPLLPYMGVPRFDVNRQASQHRDIFEAISLRNVRWAEAAMLSHAETTRELLVTSVPRAVARDAAATEPRH